MRARISSEPGLRIEARRSPGRLAFTHPIIELAVPARMRQSGGFGPMRTDVSARQYVYASADGVFLQACMEDHGECMLVLIGATP